MVSFIFIYSILIRIIKRAGAERTVILKRGKLECCCKNDIYYGIPCRHQVIIFTQNMCNFSNLPFNKRWILRWINTKPDPTELVSLNQEFDVNFLF